MQIFSVTQFLTYVNETFRAVWDAGEACVEGEVSGFRISQGQWVNFDVKDEGALVSVFMVAQKLHVPLQDGMRVRLYGVPRVYPKYGKFSFNADRVELVGEGAMRKALAMLREKLSAEGLFDPSRKRALPRFPHRIALIASRESAAYGDFIRILNERWGGLEIDLYHVLVQGDGAPPQIVEAIERANVTPPPSGHLPLHKGRMGGVRYDALVLTRGGGSFEELMAFNDERLVRALYASKIPTLVGIGHERDLTLAEEVADVRGSTPTDCARRLAPDRRDVIFEMASMVGGMENALLAAIAGKQQVLRDAFVMAERWVRELRQRVSALAELATAYDPRAVVRRGFAIIRDPSSGRVLVSAKAMKINDAVRIDLRDGTADAVVRSVKSSLL